MKRLEKVRKGLQAQEIDGLLVTSAVNRRYLTGFTGTAGAVLISEKGAVFITDFRYTEQAQAQVKGYDIVEHKASMPEMIGEKANELGIKKLGFEKHQTTYQEYELYKSKVSSTLVPVSGIIEELRLNKNEEELNILAEAANIADAAFDHITTYIRPGVTEIEVSNELEFFMRKKGADSSSFDIIVASGERSALPHGVASEKEIQSGELVTLDFGAYYKGYCSDITRTVAVGEPDEELKKIYQTVYEAQLKAMEEIKPGMTGVEADSVAREHIKKNGFGDKFGHGLGHGLGMEVHEEPRLSPKGNKELTPGMVVTVEPGIYVAGLGGTRIEDDIVITENGNRSLTHSPKELIILGE
ncbi:Xaa-Pro peptidase family protein [Thalassobacillus sp. C254]|uniref:M24 family metallopeptidase n=1 Tax=Thalassobacillus sp. C254 TaxID=1225341 RepID=UPI0006D0F175|nr:Xaa-Pro peptidase family protein [Thalassobacillus sp. C254]